MTYSNISFKSLLVELNPQLILEKQHFRNLLRLRNMLLRISIMCFLALAYHSCIIDAEVPESIDGLRPIYVNINYDDIRSEEARYLGDLGKIVLKGDLLFVNELFKGIHVIDNSDPRDPVNIAFWNIPGNVDFTIADNLLYADNSRDIYVIDISDIYAIELRSVIENAYSQPLSEQLFPRDYSGFFECVDPAQGIVVDWEQVILESPKCSI